MEARHARRVRQAQHEAARTVIGWAVARRIGTLAVGDPRGVLDLAAGRRHNRRTRDWRVGRLISVLRDKAGQAGITLTLLDERGTSSTCPACRARVPKPAGRVFCCPRCGLCGHRDLIAAANIAGRGPAGSRRPSRGRVTTAAPGTTFRVCPRRDVTRAAALITAPPAGPLAGTCPPRRTPRRPGSRSPHREDLVRPLRNLRRGGSLWLAVLGSTLASSWQHALAAVPCPARFRLQLRRPESTMTRRSKTQRQKLDVR